MLVDLKAPLQQGKTVEATLNTSDGGTVQVELSRRRDRSAGTRRDRGGG